MALKPGTRLGPYEVNAPLGAGSMGEVYRARDARLDRDVAIKVLPEAVAGDPHRLARFEREAKAIAKLSHPNILGIFDFGREGEITYAVTELLSGETLRSQLRSGRLPVRKAVEYASRVSDGLAAAHDKGIIHRDLKPENVFVTRYGHVKILDFGLAKIVPTLSSEEDPTQTRRTAPGTVLGTVGYMSPEQVRGRDVDHRTDIFSLGAMLYEMLSGRRAFKGDSAADTMSAILQEDPGPLSETEAGVFPVLEALVRRCLEKNPEERFQSARDLGFALQSVSAEKKDSGTGRRAGVSDERDEPSIAVLPFANMSPDPEQEYFCEGMAEEIINALTKIEGLRVAARMSTFQFKGRLQDARQVGDALNVKMLLEGSVRSAGDRLRVTAQLINVEDGYHLWSERYDRQMEDVFAIQDEIASKIVDVLKLKLGQQELPRIRRATGNLEAYHLYLKGRHFWHHRQPEMQRRALEAYRQAKEKDPGYALAHAGIAWIHVIMALYGLIPPGRAYQEVKRASERALDLDDTYADVQICPWAFGLFFERDWNAAERAIQRAIDLEPTHVEAHCFYGIQLSSAGRHEEALREVKRAQESDPLSTYANSLTGWTLLDAGRTEEAVSEFQKALDIDPDYVLPLPLLAGAYVRSSQHEEAVSILQRVATMTDRSPFHVAWLGWASGVAGDRDQARSIHQELIQRSESEYVSPLYVAWVLSELPDEGDAFEWLERAFEEGSPYLVWWRTPVFDGLRTDPRFHELLKRFNFPV
jgi:serine/threonine-protein kinase